MSTHAHDSASHLPTVAPPLDAAQWFKDEVHPHEGQLKAYLRGSFPSVRDVDDVVQESYVRIWRRQIAAPISSAKSFLFRIARNIAVDNVRHAQASPLSAVTDFECRDVLDTSPCVDQTIHRREEMELLAEAIEALPARCREIVILRKLERVPQKEIASRLGISEQTVQVQAVRGLRKCEEFLRARGVSGGLIP